MVAGAGRSVRVLVVHDRIDDEARADELDVLNQVAAVREALRRLGHDSEVLVCDLDLAPLVKVLETRTPDLVFNLAECLGGRERLLHVIPSVLEALGVPFTGSPAAAILASTNKAEGKRRLTAAGLPVARTFRLSDLASEVDGGPYIVKSMWCHGSVGLDDEAIVSDPRQLKDALQRLEEITGGPCLAETFLPGREFNISVLEGPDGPFVLPPAEIRFDDFPPGKPRFVGQKAKWAEDSFEFAHTPRSFEFGSEDQELLEQLRALSIAAWTALGSRGYARVDFRLDSIGAPVILELNINPCLSSDAGFAAALAEAGLSFDDGVKAILDASVGGRPGELAPTKPPPDSGPFPPLEGCQ